MMDDLKYLLFGGLPILAEGYGKIRPLTVKEVIEFGYTNYMVCLNLLNLEKEDLLKVDINDAGIMEALKDINALEVLITLGGEELQEKLCESLGFFLGGEAILDKEEMSIIIKFDEDHYEIVNRDNYDSIREVIKWQNYINHFTEAKGSFTPADEKARKLKERMEALKKKTEELKRKQNGDEDDSNIEFYDILSAIASKSNSINEINIVELTIYQVYSKFKRLEVIDQYDISIKSMLAGAQNIKLNHWSNKAD